MTKILTVENQSYDLDMVPEEIEDIRYCVLDYSNPKEADYIFVPLVFLESFNSPAAVLQVGENQVKVPLDWSLVVCDPSVGDPEVLPVTSLNDRGFKAFVFNPLTGFLPAFTEIEIVNIYHDQGVNNVSIGVQTFTGIESDRDFFECAAMAGAKHISCHFQLESYATAITTPQLVLKSS